MKKIEPPYYPIVYVRGYAMRHSEREETFHDAYYGFSATSVEKRQAPEPKFFEADLFEGQFIRLMKIKDYAYADVVNRGLEHFHSNPSRSIWICRFYDEDYIREQVRSIETHAEDLWRLVCKVIPERLKACGVDLGSNDKDYKVNLVAHSMGGLVCRTLLQNILPIKHKQDPKRWVNKLVTMGTPHGGIDLGRIPDLLENFVVTSLNPFDANIFKEKRMRQYLNLNANYEVHSLGTENDAKLFPVKKCLCIVGSDYRSYNAVQHATGSHSDGLVKQDRAYVVSGKPDKNGRYSFDQKCFWANVHRAHSGFRGIVNSYESYENLQRFLFGNVRADIYLEGMEVKSPKLPNSQYFYDLEFALTIRGTSTYLHRRQQDPCENAIRRSREQLKNGVYLHTLFMNTGLKMEPGNFSHFALSIRVVEHRIKKGFLWDNEYPGMQIYSEELEARVGDSNPDVPGDELEVKWRSEAADWQEIPCEEETSGVYLYEFNLRASDYFRGRIKVRVMKWE